MYLYVLSNGSMFFTHNRLQKGVGIAEKVYVLTYNKGQLILDVIKSTAGGEVGSSYYVGDVNG
jgi:hypothetical protein